MKCVQVLLLVFAFFIFPIFINAIAKFKCQKGRTCHLSPTTTIMDVRAKDAVLNNCPNGCVDEDDKDNAKCEDACVYFKCVIPGHAIYEGAGCYNHFVNICLFTKTETKNQVIKNITSSSNSSEYYDSTTMVVTCKSDNCARDAFEKMAQKNGGTADKVFGKAFDSYTGIESETCDYGVFRVYSGDYNRLGSRNFPEKVQCAKREWCETGKNYDLAYKPLEVATQDIKYCDACVYYRCTGDGGRSIMGGIGCYEDFDQICQVVPSDVKTSIKKNIKDSFHYGDNYMVTTCASDKDCGFDAYAPYYDANPLAKIKADITADGTCEPGVAGSVPSSLQFNIWMLIGLVLAGFFYRMA